MDKSILDVMHETAKGLTDAGVMDVKTMSEFEELTQHERETLLYITDDYYEISGGIKQLGIENTLDKSQLLRMTVQKEEEYLHLKSTLIRYLEDIMDYEETGESDEQGK